MKLESGQLHIVYNLANDKLKELDAAHLLTYVNINDLLQIRAEARTALQAAGDWED